MPKTKKVAVKVKQKLSPAERSQIAKDRWANRRARLEAIESTPVAQEEIIQAGSPPPVAPDQPVIPQNPTPEQPPVAPESITTNVVTLPSPVAGGEQLPVSADTIEAIVEERVAQALRGIESQLLSATPAPQLVPVAPQKKQKKTPVPKEFLVALKTADKRLADAIDEFEECSSRINYLKDAIPRLQRTVLALRNESNPDAPTNPNNAFNPAALYSSPPAIPHLQPYIDPLAAIQGAAAATPVSRASGGAMQFTPEMLGGNLEGPEDDDIDRFITGPAASEKGWV